MNLMLGRKYDFADDIKAGSPSPARVNRKSNKVSPRVSCLIVETARRGGNEGAYGDIDAVMAFCDALFLARALGIEET